MPLRYLFPTAILVALPHIAFAQTALHAPCLQNAADAAAATTAYMTDGWAVPEGDDLTLAYATVGEQHYYLVTQALAAPGVEQWQQRLDRAAQRGEFAFSEDIILHRGADALVIDASPDGRIENCFVAGQDLPDVVFEQDEDPVWPLGNRLAAARIMMSELTPPDGVDRVQLFLLQTWQPFEVPFTSPGNEMVALSFRWE